YPTIFSLAMDILPIQASAVPCERVFSSSKETTTPRRNHLSAKMMEVLQMLKFSAKKRHALLNFTLGLSKDHELEMMENEQRMQIAEDAPSFSRILTNSASLSTQICLGL
ncbi:hypothetical protein WOLCODRAFT_74512, partial [Wolfiporia cocos MD-104 SS10]